MNLKLAVSERFIGSCLLLNDNWPNRCWWCTFPFGQKPPQSLVFEKSEVKNERRELERRGLERRGLNVAELERRRSERRIDPNVAVLNVASTRTSPF